MVRRGLLPFVSACYRSDLIQKSILNSVVGVTKCEDVTPTHLNTILDLEIQGATDERYFLKSVDLLNLTEIRSLSMDVGFLSIEALSFNTDELKQLKSLSLHSDSLRLSDDFYTFLARLRGLTSLSLSYIDNSVELPRSLSFLINLTELRSLTLKSRYIPFVSANSSASLSRLINLESLILYDGFRSRTTVVIPDEFSMALVNLINLKSLFFASTYSLSDDFSSDQFSASLSVLTNLTELTLDFLYFSFFPEPGTSEIGLGGALGGVNQLKIFKVTW